MNLKKRKNTTMRSKPPKYQPGKELVLDGQTFIVVGYEDSAQVPDTYIRLEDDKGNIISKSREWVAALLKIQREETTA